MVPTQSAPLALRIAAGYMLLAGICGLVWPLLKLPPHRPEFQSQSRGYKIGAYTRELAVSGAYVIAGLGLYWHHAWGRKLALMFLVIGAVYTANAFAWGFSNGPPTPRARLFSRIVVASWNGLWFYLIYRLAVK